MNLDDDLGPTANYARVAPLYDGTRHVPPDVLRAAYLRAREVGILPDGGLVVDVGSGTGQASLPLAALGYDILGYDVTPQMVEIANRKAVASLARYAVADVRRLPEPDRRFDAAVAAKLFPHVSRWQAAAREIVRVLKPGACLLLVDERGGRNPVREDFTGRLKAAGVALVLPGCRDPEEIASVLVAEGCRREVFDASGLAWRSRTRLGEAFDQLRDRLSAEFWSVPDAIYDAALAETAAWLEAQPGGRETAPETEPRLSIEVFRKIG